MLVLALVGLLLHNSMRLHVSQCFHWVKTDNVQKTHFCADERVLAHLTSFLLKNAFKRRERLVLALFSLILYNSMRLHIPRAFNALKLIMCERRVFSAN